MCVAGFCQNIQSVEKESNTFLTYHFLLNKKGSKQMKCFSVTVKGGGKRIQKNF